MVIGWPALGAIGRVKETTTTTIISATFQCGGLVVLILAGQFSIVNIAILRCATEFVLLAARFVYCLRYRSEFNQ
jgi:PST family polysaccharide transporter